jgi:hypothetical protein
VLVAALLIGCATATPSPSPSEVGPSPSASTAAVPSPTATPTPTAVPTPTLAPTPLATIVPAGVEAFSDILQGRWELIASEDNLGRGTEVKVLAPMGEFVEVFIHCSGSGTLDVRISGAPPATDPPDPLATPYILAAATVECPETTGTGISLAGTAPAGWFASPEAAPSDPSIGYQVLIGTIVD